MLLPLNSIVFGGSGHLGMAVCETLMSDSKPREGSQVIATCYQNDIENRLTDLKKQGLSLFHCNVRQQDSINQTFDEIKNKINRLSSMVYAVGSFDDLTHDTIDGPEYNSLQELSVNQIQASIALHAQGAISACQATVSLFREAGGGNIVLTGSLNGLKLVPSPVHFAAAKSALLGITQALAKELGRDNIRINLVIPGMIDGPGLQNVPQKQKDLYLKHSALRRFADSQEIAEVVSWFALENTYVTGQAIILDGGL